MNKRFEEKFLTALKYFVDILVDAEEKETERKELIEAIESLYPADAAEDYYEIGAGLLYKARSYFSSWRTESLEVLREYKRLCEKKETEILNQFVKDKGEKWLLTKTQTKLKKSRLQSKILREIENNYYEAKLQKEQISAMKESISEAKLAVKMARIGYKEGTITNLDLINTQKLYTQTKMEYLKAVYNFYRAKVNLFKSTGKLKEDLSWLKE